MGLARRAIKRVRKAVTKKAIKKKAKSVAKTALKGTAVAAGLVGVSAATAALTKAAYQNNLPPAAPATNNDPKNRTGTTNYIPGKAATSSSPADTAPSAPAAPTAPAGSEASPAPSSVSPSSQKIATSSGYGLVKNLARDLSNHEVGKVLRKIAKKLNLKARRAIRKRRR